MVMSFTIIERILLLDMLKTVSGGITTLRILTELMNDLGFTEDEHKELEFKEVGGTLSWNPIPDREVSVGEKAADIIAQTLRAASDGERLTLEHMSLVEKFIPEELADIEAA